MANTRKPGGGRKPSKPEYSAAKNLAQQMEAAVDLYTDKTSLQAIADALSLNPIKVRKLLITAGVYESDTAKLVQQTFDSFRSTQSYSAAVTSTMSALQLSRPSVTSYLPYEKGVYFPEEAEAANISAGAERQRHYRAVVVLKRDPCEVNLWKCVVAFRGYKFKTLSGLPFTYTLKKGRGDEFTKELWIDRREDSKSLAWSSVLLDQLYWVGSAGLGAALGTVLPFSTEGVDFVMTAMFTVIFLNQWEKDQQHGSALIGLAVPLVCLMVFGSGSFLLPSMGGILVLLLALRRPMEKAAGEVEE